MVFITSYNYSYWGMLLRKYNYSYFGEYLQLNYGLWMFMVFITSFNYSYWGLQTNLHITGPHMVQLGP
jgi:hypothetical protein